MKDGRSQRAALAREHRRRQILDGSLAVFARQGYWQTSITDLVEAVGVARGTFYLYFESKEAIFHALVEDLLDQLRGVVVKVDPQGAPVSEQLERLLTTLFATIAANRDLTRLLFREAVGLDRWVDERLEAFDAELRALIGRALELGEALGWVRPGLDRPLVAAALLGLVRGVVQRYVVEVEAPEPGRAARAVVSVALPGLAR